MAKPMLAYIAGDSSVHRMPGALKIIIFLMWSILAMAGYDTRIMLVMTALGFAIFAISGIKLRDVAFIFKMLAVFMALNLIAVYIFAPEQGVLIYKSRHVIWAGLPADFGGASVFWQRFTLTHEELFYEFNLFLKYLIITPAATVLMTTTHPSEMAASLNKIGVPYFASYAFAIALRYIPDVQNDYENISLSQQARGLELSKKARLGARLAGISRILMPLLFQSLERIDVVSRAMELRNFGKHKKRTWYAARRFTAANIATLLIAVLLFALGMCLTFRDGNRFYNPF
ncbi:MAG: energy-coupling factor transporter transmembrane component T [Treponemataceae bacterium]|nr:MAG: energy-coupling factor transporter transmembrane component T [Treponemataceae bacterium]